MSTDETKTLSNEETPMSTDESKAGSEEMTDKVDRTRRALIHAGWIIPAIIAVQLPTPTVAFASSAHADAGGHVDDGGAHVDGGAHADG